MSNATSQYPEYKPTSVTWIGDVPSHWIESKLKRETAFQVGWTPPTKNAANFDGENHWANISDLRYRTVWATAKQISDAAALTASMSISPKGSLLYSFKLSVGAVAFAGTDMYTNEAIATFLSCSRLPLSYLYYALPIFVIQNASTNIYGARILNQELIRNADILAPPRREASQIAAFLDHETSKIDALIAKQQQLIALLQEKRQAVISHAVTKGLDPQAPMRDSGIEWLGKVPEHWKVTELRRVGEFLGGGTPSKGNDAFWEGDIPWVSPKDMKVNYIETAIDKITEEAISASSTSLIPTGSILIVVRGMILAHSAPVALTTASVTINQDMKAIVVCEIIDNHFLLHLLKGLRDYLLDHADDSAHGTKAMDTGRLARMAIPLPPKSEQTEIVSHLEKKLESMDRLVGKANHAMSVLQERRTALISAAVTGKIDVRDWKAPAPKEPDALEVV